MSDKPKIALRPNSTLANDPCALCGGHCHPKRLDYMLQGTTALVCDACAKKHAPDLVAALEQALEDAYDEGHDAGVLDGE